MIECSHVYKRYKTGTNALYDINLSIAQGEFIYVIGPTGSGKSTLIRILDGEIVPTKGTVKVVGIDVGHLKNRQDIDARSQYPSMKGNNFSFKFLGEHAVEY